MRRSSITIEHHCGAPIVTPNGDIDLANVDGLEAALAHALALDKRRLIVSFEHVTYFDSSIISCLIEHAKRLQRHGGELVLVAPVSTTALRAVEVVRLDAMFATFSTVDEAVNRSRRTRREPNAG